MKRKSTRRKYSYARPTRRDRQVKAKKAGWRKTKSGKRYYEARPKHSDKYPKRGY